MGFQINTNVSALNAFSNMKRTQSRLSLSLERLSSGLRINRAADDAAGMAIANKLKAQAEGLGQALKNANDGISMMQIADGALAQAIDIVTTIRTKAAQAASDGVDADSRLELQADIDQLINQMDNIGNTTTFNGIKLLDGTFSSKTLQVGAYYGETISISIGDNRASRVGAQAIQTTNTFSDDGTTDSLFDIATGAVTINGVAVGTTTGAGFDTVSSVDADSSAISKAAAVNAITSQTGVTAEVQSNVVTGTAAIAATTLNSSGVTLTINGVQIGGSSQITVLAQDSDSALRNAINSVSNQTGVTASIDSSGALVLTAEDGRNIDIVTATTDFASLTGGSAGNYTRSAAIKLLSDNAFIIAGTGAATQLGLAADTYNVDVNTAINKVDVTTQSGAASAIETADAALSYLNKQRATIGSVQINLTNATANLSTMKTNVAAAESQIRNVDFAEEVANFTNQQILVQAGTFALAQANTTPQQVLQLLR